MKTLIFKSKFAALSIALLGLLGFSTAFAQVEITRSIGTHISGTTSNFSLTGFDPGIGANKLIVAVSAEGSGATRIVSGITFGDSALTLAITSGNQRRTEIWFLDNPGSNPADISVTWTGTTNGLGIAVYSLANAASGAPTITGAIEGNSLTVTTTQDNSLVIASYVSNDGTNNDGVLPALPADSPYNLTYGLKIGSALGAAGSHFLSTPGDSTFTILEPSPFASTAAIVVESLDVEPIPLIVTTLSDELDTPVGAELSLREAISIAPSGETITFASNLNGGTIQLDPLQGELVIEKSLTIDAAALPDGIIIDGGSNGNFVRDEDETRCFAIPSADSTSHTVFFKNLTIQNGVDSSVGGNIVNFEDLTLENCRILNGRAPFAGGIAQFGDDSLTLISSQVSRNRAFGAGGIGAIIGESNLVMIDCTVSENRAGGFGEIDVDSGDVEGTEGLGGGVLFFWGSVHDDSLHGFR